MEGRIRPIWVDIVARWEDLAALRFDAPCSVGDINGRSGRGDPGWSRRGRAGYPPRVLDLRTAQKSLSPLVAVSILLAVGCGSCIQLDRKRCDPGELVCDGARALRCVASGDELVLEKVCASAGECQSGACVPAGGGDVQQGADGVADSVSGGPDAGSGADSTVVDVSPDAGSVDAGPIDGGAADTVDAASDDVGGCAADSACDDGDPCTTDACDVGTCQHEPSTDGVPCPGGFCDGGECQPSPCVANAPDPDTLGLWHLDDAGGGGLADSSGHGLQAVEHGPASAAAGKFGVALGTGGPGDGAPAHAVTGESEDLALGAGEPFTLEAWVWLDGAPSAIGSVVSLGAFDGSDEGGLALEVATDGRVRLNVRSKTSEVGIDSTEPLEVGRWHHLAAIRSDSFVVSLYVDHVFEASDSLGGPLDLSRGARFGRRFSVVNAEEHPLAAHIDEVRLSSVARAPQAFQGCSCPEAMREVGNRACVDEVEASVWGSKTCEGTSYGLAGDDYPIPDTGGGAAFACAVPGVLPSRFVTYNQAHWTCKQAGKELCDPELWTLACRGVADLDYPYGDAYVADACNGAGHPGEGVAATGSLGGCVSDVGVFDLSGNVAEWVASPTSGPWMALGGSALSESESALACPPGGSAFEAQSATESFEDVGFRCCTAPLPGL